jgi:cytochrome c
VDSFEWNKVFGAIIATALFVMVIMTFSESVFHRAEGEKPAFTVEVETTTVAEAVVEEGPSLAVLLADADAGRGAKQWGKCRACHTIDKGGKNGAGPNLYGVVGRSVAALDNFKYSSALAGQNVNWTWELLDQWLTSPKKTFKGTSMGFAGLKKEGQRADLLAYMATMSDAPVAFPTAEVIVDEGGEAVEETAAEDADHGTDHEESAGH